MPFPQSRLSLFSAHEATPPPAGMRTIPCTGLDLLIRSVVVTAGFIIHAQLDAKRLEDALKAVIERKFPRVGARLARRNGVYEFQIPGAFNANTPSVAFTAEHYPEAYRSSPRPVLPTDFPDSLDDASQPSIHPMPELDVYFKSSQCPTSLAGFLVPNTPLLHVHVAVFDDLTFIGITASHVLWDALGRQTVLLAWTRVLSGEAIENISGMDWDAAPFEVFTGPAAGTTPRGWYKLGMFSQLLFIARRWLHVIWDPKAEARTGARRALERWISPARASGRSRGPA
ncbi:hypothetical protein FB451DRAFT_1049809 [Mycena latifolia]|nr:hypothetical protein FB451DRAFT_1049809 [Mycena latifolia]